jgi:tetratricopeptide (TPR) repeat protein
LEKLNDSVIDLWCQLLADVPASRLLLARNTLHGATAQRCRDRFAQRGLAPERLLLMRPDVVAMSHLRLYDQIDIALDAFPFSGHTTACDALWMGVPVITLRGSRHAGRLVASALTALGLSDLIAESPTDYRRIATALAADRARRATLRSELRHRMRTSPLCDAPALARNVETTYRALWRQWCAAPERVSSPLPKPNVQTTSSLAPPLPAWERGLGGEGRPRISLTMIVKNEEANLPDCLRSAADLFDEVIIVDTGSTDRTKDVALGFGARVFDFPWLDSFSAARNESLRHATGDWVFWLDADDRLDDDNRAKLRALFAGLGHDNAAYSLKCLCVPAVPTDSATQVDHVRLFRNLPEVRWRYRVHEQIIPAVRASGAEVRWADVVIRHTGYQDRALRQRKLQRDLRLLELERAEQPNDPFTLFNIGQVLQELGRHADALPLLKRSLELSHPNDSIVRKLYALIAGCHDQLGQSEESLAACTAGRRVCPDDAELLFLEGALRRQAGDLEGARTVLRLLLESSPAKHFASIDPGLRTYRARHQLALVCRQAAQDEEAERLLRHVLDERPGFLPARVALAELFLAQQRWDDLESTTRALASSPPGELDAAVLRCRAHLARRDFPAARAAAEGAIHRWPDALPPRVLLSHALLQEDKDHAAAEKALHEVLALAPDHANARHNLRVLLARKPVAASL